MSAKELKRPVIQHAESQPELLNIHGNSGEVIDNDSKLDVESSSESDADLLEYLNKVDLTYRNIKFKIPNKPEYTDIKRNYQKRVSFDTINLQYDRDDDDDEWQDTQFDDYDDYDFDRGRSRSKGPSPNVSPLHSPTGSPLRRIRSPMRGSIDLGMDDQKLARMISNHFKPQYPTSPIITHRGCTFTKLHNQFEDLYLEKLNNKEHNYLLPVLPNRVILVYITARKHTWVALDWILNKFIQHGDSVIIVSAINLNFLSKRRYSNYTSPDKIVAKTPRMRLRQRNRPEFVKVIAKNIMSYVMEVINPNVIAKVSIELAVGKSKKVLQEMYKLYEPNLVATGTKPNTRIGAPLRSWHSSKLTDRLVKNFPLPVIIIPALNMNSFELQLENEVNSKYDNAVKSITVDTETPNTKILRKAKEYTPPPLSNDDETASISSLSSEESYSSFDEITNAYDSYKQEVNSKLDHLSQDGYNYQFFTESLKAISDKSADFCREVKSIDPDFRGRGAKLARAITGSNSFGVVPYKTKSLLEPVETSKSAQTSASDVPKVSYKELKKRLNEKSKQPSTPAIQVSSPPKLPQPDDKSSSPPPPKQTLKFINLEAPSKEKERKKSSSSSSSKDKAMLDMKFIQKSFSNDVEAYSNGSRPKLEPLKSHPDLTATYASNNDEPKKEKKHKKKKSRKFWKLFS